MVLLDVICLVVALVAVAFAVVALARARAADDRSSTTSAAIARVESTARAAAAGVEQLESRVTQARQDAVRASEEAARAAQAAAQASASASASRIEAEAASDKASRAEAEAAKAEAGAARIEADTARIEAAAGRDEEPPAGADDEAEAVGGRASVQRAEAGDVSGGVSGDTERVVQVAWKLTLVRNSTWELRNTGLAVARDALLSDATMPPKFVRPDEVIPRDVDRDDALRFRVTVGRGAPPPRIRVTWREGAGSPAYSREFTVLAAS